MGCCNVIDHEDIQAALSARLDGEPHELNDAVVDAHLAECEECTAFWENSVRLSQRLSYVDSPSSGMAPPADLADVILAGVEPEWRRRARGRQASLIGARITAVVIGILFVLSGATMVLSTGGLVPVSGDGTVLDPTAQPELAALVVESAALRLAVGVSLMLAAWRTGLAAGMVPLLGMLWTFLFGFTVRDLIWGIAGMQQAFFVLLLALATIVLVWLWMAGSGLALRNLWRELGARPL